MPIGDNRVIAEAEINASGKFPLCKRLRAACMPLDCYQFKRGKVQIKLTTDVITFRVLPCDQPCYDTFCAGEDVIYNDFAFKPADYSGVLLTVTRGLMCYRDTGVVRICFGPPPQPPHTNPTLTAMIEAKETGVAANAYVELNLYNSTDIAQLLQIVSCMNEMKGDVHPGMKKGIADGVFPAEHIISRENTISVKGATPISREYIPLASSETFCTGVKPGLSTVALFTDRQIIVAYRPCCSRTTTIFCYPIRKTYYVSMMKIPGGFLCGRAAFVFCFKKLTLRFVANKGACMKFMSESMKYLFANGTINTSHTSTPTKCVLPRIADEQTQHNFPGTARFCGTPIKSNPCCPLWNMEISNYFIRVTMGAREYCVPVKNVTGWHINRNTHRKGKCELCTYGKEKGKMNVEMIAKGLSLIPKVEQFTLRPLEDADNAIKFIEDWFDALQ